MCKGSMRGSKIVESLHASTSVRNVPVCYCSFPLSSCQIPRNLCHSKTSLLRLTTLLDAYVSVQGSLGEEFYYKDLALVKLIIQVTVSKVFNSAMWKKMHCIAFLFQCLNLSWYGLLPKVELWRIVEDIRIWVQDFADLLSYLWPIAVPFGNYDSCRTTGTAGPSQHSKDQNIYLLSRTQEVVQSWRHYIGCGFADGNCSPPFWSH
jgi:hypothetical protein